MSHEYIFSLTAFVASGDSLEAEKKLKAMLESLKVDGIRIEEAAVYAGFTTTQLSRAFDKVRNPKDWKLPIKAIIDAKDQAVVEATIGYHVYGGATFRNLPGGKLEVRAPGYYAGEC